jgi:polysaccharide pyruvyl transferase WcaK-like protein
MLIILYGGYETGNYGDAIDRKAILDAISSIYPDADIVDVGPNSFPAIGLDGLFKADVVVLAGGGQFMNLNGSGLPYLPLVASDMECLCKKTKVIVWGCGFNRDMDEAKFEEGLISSIKTLSQGAALIGLRTPYDCAKIEKMDANLVNCVRYCPPPCVYHQGYQEVFEKTIGISLSTHTPMCAELLPYWASVIRAISERAKGYAIQVLPTPSKGDIIAKQMTNIVSGVRMDLCNLPLEEAVKKCSVVVANRFHVCVLSLATGVPAIILNYNEKCQSLARSYVHWMSVSGGEMEPLLAATAGRVMDAVESGEAQSLAVAWMNEARERCRTFRDEALNVIGR